MATIFTMANSIVKETAGAYLVEANGNCWLPKSQVAISEICPGQLFEGKFIVEMPGWLWYKTRSTFTVAGQYRAMEIAAENLPKTKPLS